MKLLNIKITYFGFLVFLFAVVFSAQASAQISTLMSLQGKATDPSGSPLSGNLTVSIGNSSATCQDGVYNETFTNGVSAGVFDVLLGNTTTLSLEYNKDYYMCINVNGIQINGPFRFRGGQGEIGPEDLKTNGSYSFGDVSAQNILPKVNTTYNLGNTTNYFNNLYLGGEIICSNCINDSAISDIYVLKTGDTMTGNLNMSNNLILNIGNPGTDFTSTGGLNLTGIGTFTFSPSGTTSTTSSLVINPTIATNDADLIWAGASSLPVFHVDAEGDINSLGGLTLAGPATFNGDVSDGFNINMSGNRFRVNSEGTVLFEVIPDLSVNINGINTITGATFTNNVDMNNNRISNIGAAGTDFTSGGGLALAGNLNANGNIVGDGATQISGISRFVMSSSTNDAFQYSFEARSGGASDAGQIDLDVFSNDQFVASNGLVFDINTSSGLGSNALTAITIQDTGAANTSDTHTGININLDSTGGIRNDGLKISVTGGGTYNDAIRVTNGRIEMTSNVIENIGNPGTDFTSGGGLALAGNFTVQGSEINLSSFTNCSLDTDATGTVVCGTDDIGSDTYVNISGDTMTGNLNMSNNLILDIGNNGTDFTSGGGLNLAGSLSVTGDISSGIDPTFDWKSTAGTLEIGDINGFNRFLLNSSAPTLILYGAGEVERFKFNLDTPSLDMLNTPILNIGNAGTDFTSGGGLNLAGNVFMSGANEIQFRDATSRVYSPVTNQLRMEASGPVAINGSGTGIYSHGNSGITIDSANDLTIDADDVGAAGGGSIRLNEGNTSANPGSGNVIITSGDSGAIGGDGSPISITAGAGNGAGDRGTINLYGGDINLTADNSILATAIDMQNNIISNIGAAGTDFGTDGSLTLAGVLTADSGILLNDNDTASFGSGTDMNIYYNNANNRLHIDDAGIASSTGIFIKGGQSVGEAGRVVIEGGDGSTMGGSLLLSGGTGGNGFVRVSSTAFGFLLSPDHVGTADNDFMVEGAMEVDGQAFFDSGLHLDDNDDIELGSNSGGDVNLTFDGTNLVLDTVTGTPDFNIDMDVNMSNNLIQDIGNAGTDFTSTGGLNLNDSLIVGGVNGLTYGSGIIVKQSAWTISSGDELTFSALQFNFDTGIVNLSNNLNMNNNIITNIGNAGTDFDSSGGLNLNGNLTFTTGNFAVDVTTPRVTVPNSGGAPETPGLVFAGDTDTGFGQIAQDGIEFYTGGADRFTVASTGLAAAVPLYMSDNIITNIGNAGTDFDANGGLTLAGNLTLTNASSFLTLTATSDNVCSVSGDNGRIYINATDGELYFCDSGTPEKIST